jgi:hypothetical protein
MSDLKLFMVYHLGEHPCCNVRVANSLEEAMTQCLNHSGKPKPNDAAMRSCKVEEVKVNGYKITIEKI